MIPTTVIDPRIVRISCITLLLLMAMGLVPTLVFQIHLQNGVNAINRGDLDRAEKSLLKSGNVIFAPVFPKDKVNYLNARGDLSFSQGENASKLNTMLNKMIQAEAAYREATTIEPLNLDSYTGLTRATVTLSRLYPFLKKTPWPHEPLPLFDKLIQLMPTNLYSHELLMRYYEKNGNWPELAKVAKRAVFLYPPLYYQLKKQPFYTAAMEQQFKEVLQDNLKQDVFKKHAYRVLSDITYNEQNYRQAVDYYLQIVEEQAYKDTSADNLRLAFLQLKAGQQEEAQQSYLTALQSPKREEYLSAIWRQYEAENQYQDFLSLLKKTDEKYNLSDISHILQAQCLLKMDQKELALNHLLQVTNPAYEAQSLYIQAQIAKQKEDWDAMELTAQKATALDPTKAQYHSLFIQSLEKQRKWQPAESAAVTALQSVPDNPWLYNKRAWLRWRLKDYQGAMEDWDEAVKISPQNADFHYYLAGGLEKIDKLDKAIIEIQKAIKLKSDNPKYQKKYQELQEKLQKETNQ